jgi:outer membrane immunogenic protein
VDRSVHWGERYVQQGWLHRRRSNRRQRAVQLGGAGHRRRFRLDGPQGQRHAANTINTNTQWTSTVTGRVGTAFDRLLVYGKGGVAFANDESSINFTSGASASTTFTRTSWTAGAGIEYALAQNWTAKIEYDYLGFGSETLDFGPSSLPTNPSASLNVQEVKAGINFKFGP